MVELMRLLPNLKVLDCSKSDNTEIHWEAFEAICKTSAENMTVLRLHCIYRSQKSKKMVSPIPATVFQAFKSITRLRWCSGVRFNMVDNGCNVPQEILSSLVELEYVHMEARSTKSGRSLLAVMSHMDLPALRILILGALGIACPEAAQFLQCHGTKITALELADAYCTPAEEPGSFLRCCPSLTRLTIAGDFLCWTRTDRYRPMFQSFSPDTHPLQALYISLKDAPGIVPHSIPTDPDDPCWLPDIYALDIHQVWPWSKFLDPSLFFGFPALRGISVEQIMWPETQDEMEVNYWLQLSAQLMTADIKLMDKDGRFWVPRMGDTSFRNVPDSDSE